jgi:hypothetical protein
MSIKIILLKTGETLISDVKELVSEQSENGIKQIYGYLFKDAHKVRIQKELFLTENSNPEIDDGREVQVVLSPWVPLSSDNEIVVTTNWVVTIMEPIIEVKKMYEEKTNGKNS